ncbi:MAG: hypothetical protein HW387_803 [Parachlamydiales bacterium]|nr:hypothetical protein [Parachlamydiales bacterium]
MSYTSSVQPTGNLSSSYNAGNSDDNSLPDWFNTDLPSQFIDNKNHNLDSGIMTKLEMMVEFMKDNPANLAAPQTFVLFLNQIAGAGYLTDTNSELYQYLISNPISARGIPIYDECIAVLYQQMAMSTGNNDGTNSYLQGLFGGKDPMSIDIRQTIQEWHDDYSTWSKNYATYGEHGLQCAWGSYIQNSNASDWKVDFLSTSIDDLIKQFKNNPMMAVILIMILFGSLFDDQCVQQVVGLGKTGDYLKDQCAVVDQIQSAWTKGFPVNTPDTDPTDAVNFMQSLHQLDANISNPLNSGSDPRIDSKTRSMVEDNLKTIWNEQTTYASPDGHKWTLDELYNGYYNGTSGSPTYFPGGSATSNAASHQQLLKEIRLMHDIQPYDPGTGKGGGLPDQYKEIENALKSTSQAFSDESQTITTKANLIKGYDEDDQSMLSKFLNGDTGIVGLNKVLINNQKSS